jgi:hypothetical protein
MSWLIIVLAVVCAVAAAIIIIAIVILAVPKVRARVFPHRGREVFVGNKNIY